MTTITTETTVRTVAEVAADPASTYADFAAAIVRAATDEVVRGLSADYFTPDAPPRELSACEAICKPIVMAEYRRRFLQPAKPAMEWRRCPMCGTHAKIIVGVGVCPVCDGE